MPLRPSIRCFSLIELLVALSVLALVAAIIIPRFANIRQQAAQAVVENTLKELSNHVQGWESTGGTYDVNDLLLAFHLVEFLSQPSNPNDPTRGMTTTYGGAGLDPANTCRDGGTSGSIMLATYVNASNPAHAADPDGIYANKPARASTGGTAMAGYTTTSGVFAKKGSQVYPVNFDSASLQYSQAPGATGTLSQ
jgi:prepilin-type N-terminal cleavage/methylation domain-containing protein